MVCILPLSQLFIRQISVGLYENSSSDSSTVLCMVLMRVSGRCTVLMVLLTRSHKTVQYIIVPIKYMVLIVITSTCVQYIVRLQYKYIPVSRREITI